MESKIYFETIASVWDEKRSTFFSEKVRDKALLKVNLQEGSTIVDLGCGTGYITEALADKQVHIIAIDQSSAMLDVMKSKFSNYSNISYKAGNYDALPVLSDSVNIVFANMYLHHTPNPFVAIQEAYRILITDGLLIITDLDEHDFKFLVTEQYDIWMGFRRADIENWFINAGFREVSVGCIGENCNSESEYDKRAANVNIFIATGKK